MFLVAVIRQGLFQRVFLLAIFALGHRGVAVGRLEMSEEVFLRGKRSFAHLTVLHFFRMFGEEMSLLVEVVVERGGAATEGTLELRLLNTVERDAVRVNPLDVILDARNVVETHPALFVERICKINLFSESFYF